VQPKSKQKASKKVGEQEREQTKGTYEQETKKTGVDKGLDERRVLANGMEAE
jgi:hypothetical protein